MPVSSKTSGKAAAAPAVINSRTAFVSNLPSTTSASATLHRLIGPEMAVWHGVERTAGVLSRAFGTSEGRELVRRGADYAKTAADSVKTGIDMLAKVASQEHKFGKGLAGIGLYGDYVKQVSQDVMRLKREYYTAEMVARAGNKAAGAALVWLKDPLRETEATLQRETGTLMQYYRLAEHGGAGLTGKLGKLALEGEKMLGGSDLGKQIIGAKSWWRHSGLEHGLNIGGALMDASEGWDRTRGLSVAGRATSAVMTGGVSYLSGRLPVVAGIDLAITATGAAVGADKNTVDGYKFSTWMKGTANEFFQLGRAVYHWDSRPLTELHRANMAGENGKVLQGYAMLGEKLGNTGAMEYVIDSGVSATAAISRGYNKSLQWWNSVHFH